MMFINERRVLWVSCFDECPACLGASGIDTDGHDFNTLVLDFVAECLPHGQVS